MEWKTSLDESNLIRRENTVKIYGSYKSLENSILLIEYPSSWWVANHLDHCNTYMHELCLSKMSLIFNIVGYWNISERRSRKPLNVLRTFWEGSMGKCPCMKSLVSFKNLLLIGICSYVLHSLLIFFLFCFSLLVMLIHLIPLILNLSFTSICGSYVTWRMVIWL